MIYTTKNLQLECNSNLEYIQLKISNSFNYNLLTDAINTAFLCYPNAYYRFFVFDLSAIKKMDKVDIFFLAAQINRILGKRNTIRCSLIGNQSEIQSIYEEFCMLLPEINVKNCNSFTSALEWVYDTENNINRIAC